MVFPKKILFLFLILALSASVSLSWAAPQPLDIGKLLVDRETLAQKYGFEYAFLLNYTQNLILNSSENQGKSRGLWYWDLELSQRLWKGGRLYAELEMDKNKGIDKFLPIFSWFNYNSTDNASPYVPVCYITQDLLNDRLFFAAGKTDLSNWFDGNTVANSADTQFSSAALVNNPVLPLPTKNMGVFVSFKANELISFQAGAATGDYFPTKAGFSNAFRNQIFLGEFDLSPKWSDRQGNYRFIFCSDREKYDFIDVEGVRRNNYSFALSFDQALTEHLTLFARYGLGDPKADDVENFWSAGGQLTEPVPGRKFDCLGFGVAQSLFGGDYLDAFGPDLARTEIMYELYYSLRVKEYFYITPNLQFVQHPNANKQEGGAAVCGVRFLLTF